MPKEIFYVIRTSRHQVGDNIYDFYGAGSALQLTKEDILKNTMNYNLIHKTTSFMKLKDIQNHFKISMTAQ